MIHVNAPVLTESVKNNSLPLSQLQTCSVLQLSLAEGEVESLRLDLTQAQQTQEDLLKVTADQRKRCDNIFTSNGGQNTRYSPPLSFAK